MKRTKQFFFRDQPHWQEVAGISGCTEFAGEDRGYLDRKRQMQEEQRNDYLTQINQKKQRKEEEREEKRIFDQQETMAHTHQVFMHDGYSKAHKDVITSKQNENLQMFNEKKQREAYQKQKELEEAKREIQLLNLRKVKRCNMPKDAPS